MTGRGTLDQHEGHLLERLRAVVAEAALVNEALPAEPVLAAQLGASRPALREALTHLEVEGLVSRRKRAGTLVNATAHALGARFDQQVEFADVIAASGRDPGLETLSWAIEPLGDESAARLGLSPGCAALRTVKRWTADDEPAMVAIDELPLPGPELPDGVDQDRSLFHNVVAVWGEAVEWEVARPTAEVAGGELAGWLGGAAPVMVLDLLGVARSGRLLYRAVEYHVPGVVEFGFVRTIGR